MKEIMTFESWFSLTAMVIGVIATVLSCLYAHKANERSKRLEKVMKEAEWSLTRLDADEWMLERKGPGKVKVYGYSLDRFSQPYDSIPHRFSEPQIFVEGSKWGIREELDGEDWDLIVYFNDADYVEKDDSQVFPKDADKWIDSIC
jgi:hypothetical protein